MLGRGAQGKEYDMSLTFNAAIAVIGHRYRQEPVHIVAVGAGDPRIGSDLRALYHRVRPPQISVHGFCC